ncbi:DNA polymerase III subunit delta [Natronospora cellulosivora (SeqCode)]
MDNLSKILKMNLDQLKSLYIVSSSNRFLLNSFKEKFIDKFVDESIKDFNYTYLEDGENFAYSLKNQANTPPIMSEKRFIVARTKDYFVNKQEKDNVLLSLFNNFPDTTIMLILVDGKMDGRLKISSVAKKNGEIIKVTAPKFADLNKWIVAEFKKRNKKVDGRSVKYLEQMFNNDLQVLGSEIEKISLYKVNEENIYLEDIIEIISKDRLIEDDMIFKLTDALLSKNIRIAIIILKEIIKDGGIPLRILATMIWQIKLLLQVKVLKKQGNSIQQIARILKRHQYPIKKCYQISDNFTEKELELILERFLEANLNIVTGKYEGELALELAIIA